MKTHRSLLSLMTSLCLAGLLLTSCAKEDLTPQVDALDDLARFEAAVDHLESETAELDVRSGAAEQNRRRSFDITRAAVVQAGLVSSLVGQDVTLFYPSDYAWDEAGISQSDLSSIPNLADVLLYHVLPGTVLSTDLVPGPATTLLGDDLVIELDEPRPEINDRADIYITDIARFGITIHVIDEVLNPENAPGQGGGNPGGGSGYVAVEPADLPSAILDFVGDSFPAQSITFARMDDDGYDVFLSNGWELEFDLAGNLLAVDED